MDAALRHQPMSSLYFTHPSPTPSSGPSLQFLPPHVAPYLRLREELAALLVLDVGDLTVLYLGTNSEAVAGSMGVQAPNNAVTQTE